MVLILLVNTVNVKGKLKKIRGCTMAVTKQAIVGVSIELLNRDGIENLSMRTIAKALDVKAAALYNHISGKMELYGAIAEYMCLSCALPAPMKDSPKYLRALCRAYRAMLLTVRDSTVVFETSVPATPRRVEIIRMMSDALSALGVTPENLMTVCNMLHNYVLSFVADECRFKTMPPEALEQFSEMLDPNKRLLVIKGRRFDERFEYGLRVLFTGLTNIKE
jgi:AcrR family transcriptional regulator